MRTTATVLFTDLVGSTELRARLGEEQAEELRRGHDRLLAQAVEANGGRVIKGLGDGLMATFGGASDAVAAAVAIQQAIERMNRKALVPAPLAVRIGLSAGDVTAEDDDLHGTPVIEAARLCGVAAGGQILVSEVVRLLGGLGDDDLVHRGLLDLKGLSKPVSAWEVRWAPTTATTVPLPPVLSEISRVFVGRDAELDRLERLWKEVGAGERRVALLAGEPGMGKTRLAAHLACGLHELGHIVLAGRCDEDLGVPYQPFVEALRHFVDHTPTDALQARLGRYGGELVRLLPELAERVPDLPAPLNSDPETDRYRLFDAVAGWLAANSSDDPLVLVVDDLQWAAKPTLLLLRHVVHFPEPLRLLVIATYRDTDIGRSHPLGELLADLRRDTGVERISLSGLSVGEVVGYLEAAGGRALDDDEENITLAAAIHEETDGNPFFLREVLRHLTETGGLAQRDGRWGPTVHVDDLGIPEGVRDVVGRRLSRLSDRANRVLTDASVIGTEFELAVIMAVCELDDDDLLAALEEAEAARLVTEVASGAPRYRFAHTLVRATLYDELSAGRRLRLHGRVAEAIESVHVARLADHLPALAYHYSRATPPEGKTAAKAIDYATQAGQRALDQLAYDEAVAWYQRALDLLDAGQGSDDDRLDLLVLLGEAQQTAGDPAHRETLLGAARAAERLGRTATLVRAALANTRQVTWSFALKVDEERVAAVDAALRAMGDEESPERARLLAQLGLELTWAPDRPRRVRYSDEALAMARRASDPLLLARVLLPRFYAIWSPGTLDERLAITGELLDIADTLHDPVLRFHTAWLRFRAALEAADADEGRRCARITADLAADLRRPVLRWLAGWIEAGVAHLDGRHDDALGRLYSTRELGRALSLNDADSVALTQRCGLLATGAVIPGLEEELAHAADRYHTYRCFLALARVRAGAADEARAIFAPLAGDGLASLPQDPGWMATLAGAALTAVELGDTDTAAALVPVLAPYGDQMVVAAAMPFGAVSHYLGVLCAFLGDRDRAGAFFATAAEIHARMAAPTFLARTERERARHGVLPPSGSSDTL